MKNASLLLAALVLGAGAGALSGTLLGRPTEHADEAPRDPQLAQAVATLTATTGELRQRIDELSKEVEEARMSAPAPVAARTTELTQEAIEQAVASYMAARAGDSGAAPAESVAHEPSGVASASVEDLLDMLREGELSGMQEQELWGEIRKSGRMDEVLAEYERLASLQPDNPDVQTELGNAYLQKIFDVGNGPLAGKFGNLADQAYDRALESDPEHWEARFTKAVALSNWPEFLGKTGEAIQQFETLVQQQERRPVEDRFAQTYFVLGNMYQRKGDMQKALETWRKGLALFPDSQTLREQIRVNE